MRHLKKKTTLLLTAALVLAACQTIDTTGLSAESSRQPKGNPAALVRVAEFSDLQCPACKSAHELIVKPLFEKYSDKILFEFRHFPLAQHPFAFEAAAAAECAADQGKFWEFIDVNYENQEQMNSSAFREWGKTLGLDAALFDRCIKSKIKSETINADQADGKKQNVQGTPSFFVNGARVPYNSLQAVTDTIDQVLKQVEETPL